jgi:hypothetical protein
MSVTWQFCPGTQHGVLQIFQKSGGLLKPSGVRKVILNKFHSEEAQIFA